MTIRTPALLLAVGCASGPTSTGWAPTLPAGGPTVLYDLEARPLPEIPLPNDAATRLDPRSPTGRFLNVSEEAPTQYEREVRERFNELDGFGAYGPITVAFDAPLDVDDLWSRHNDDDDFRNDAVFLLNVDPTCDRYGEEVALDLGRGRFVFTLYGHARLRDDPLAPGGQRWDHWGNTLFPFDVHSLDNTWMWNETAEDLDGDGVLDPGEDLDDDGVLDVPNLRDPAACAGLAPDTRAYDTCIADQLMTFYERETNTLILRPLWPLEERCTYAVLLTDRLKGADGAAVDSPFPGINPRDQTNDLRNAEPFLGRYGLALEDVRFAWSFTVGTATADMEALREGLYGSGPFAWMADTWPADGMELWTRRELNDVFEVETDPALADDTHLPGACISDALTVLWDQGQGEWDANMCAIEADLSSVATWFGGTFRAPYLLADKDGIATEAYPDDHDERFVLDEVAGTVEAGDADVTFFCALPHEDPDATCAPGNPDGVPFCKPFPTVIYGHGYGSSRSEFTLHMGRHTAMGQAACGLDAPGHGLNRWIEDPEASSALRLSLLRFQETQATELAGLMTLGRDRDLTNDGLPDPGLDQWSADIFHTRDMVRQSALEVTQFVRMLRHMDGETTAPDGRLLGDVDGDGVVDLGGPANHVTHWGISLGGILSGVLAGSEPGLDAVSPNAGGAGLTDISVRSTQSGVPEAVVMPMLGQLVAGCLPTDGHDNPVPVDGSEGDGVDCWAGRGWEDATWTAGDLRVGFLNQDEARTVEIELGVIPGVQPGDVLVVENLANGEVARATLHGRGWARAGVAADALGPIERRAELGWGDAPGPFDVVDTEAVGDPLQVRVERDGQVVGRLDTFPRDVVFQGTRYRAGAPLVALQDGYGYARNGPDVRRLLGFAQHAIARGDPAVWGARAFLEPHTVDDYDPFDDAVPTRVLVMPTAGDSTVPVHTGVANARTTGVLGSWLRNPEQHGPESGWRALFAPDARYGTSIDQWLVDQYVLEGDDRFRRWAGHTDVAPGVIFDADNVSDGTAAFSCGASDWSALIGENGCEDAFRTGEGPAGDETFFTLPTPAPGDELRADHPRGDGYVDGFRIPVLRPVGQHGIYNAQSFRRFDADAYMVNLTARFLATQGRVLRHEAGCDCSASAVGRFTLDGQPRYPGQQVACSTDPADAPATLRVCSPACAEAWGIRTPAEAACVLD